MLTLALITHIVAGLIGVGASYTTAMVLFKRMVSLGWFKYSAALAFFAYLLSWISGGYYYVLYYGNAVKPTIKEGAYPWAHTVVMETKEHVFLFLPVLTFILMLIAFFWGNQLSKNPQLRRVTVALASFTFVLGAAIALAGVIISGAAR